MFASRFSRTLTARKLSRNFSSHIKEKGFNSKEIVALTIATMSVATYLVVGLTAFIYSINDINRGHKIFMENLKLQKQEMDKSMRESDEFWRQHQENRNKIQEETAAMISEMQSKKILPSYKCYLLPAAAASMLTVVLYASAKR